MEQHKFKELLNRYTKGTANETETALVEAWYKSYQHEEMDVNIYSIQKEDAKQEIKKQLFQQPIKISSNNFYRLVAILAIVCTVGGLYLNWLTKENPQHGYLAIQTERSRIKKITLVDGSTIWLNAASHIRVPTNYNTNNRAVFLDEGEAFFEVTKNPKKPFIVNSPNLRVQVLGTSFNIKAYQKNLFTKVSVATGKVDVNSKNQHLALLTPRQEIHFDQKTSKFKIQKSKNTHFQAWRTGKFYFQQVSFKELALSLENNFNIKLSAGLPKVNQYQFTLTLTSDMAVDEVLKIISAIHNSGYRKEGEMTILY